jgi:hypothetical protein
VDAGRTLPVDGEAAAQARALVIRQLGPLLPQLLVLCRSPLTDPGLAGPGLSLRRPLAGLPLLRGPLLRCPLLLRAPALRVAPLLCRLPFARALPFDGLPALGGALLCSTIALLLGRAALLERALAGRSPLLADTRLRRP